MILAMNKKQIFLAGLVFAVSLWVPVSQAADNPGIPNMGASAVILDDQMQAMMEDLAREEMAHQDSYSEDLESSVFLDPEKEKKKTYKYDKKDGFFDNIEMPQRSFNNINYPY